MKTTLFVPILLVTAAGAFGLGWTIRPGTAEAAKQAAADGSKSTRTTMARSSSGKAGGKSAKAPLRSEEEFIARYAAGGEISSEDMTAAIKELMQTNDPILRGKMFAALLDNLTPENAKAAYLALSERRGGGFGRGRNEDELRLLANAWGRLDGPGAIAALKDIRAERDAARGEEGGGRGGDRGGDRGPGELISVLSGWATVDGDAAAAYVNGIEDEREQRMAAFGVLQGMLVNGVDEAMAFIGSMPEGEDGDRAKGIYMAMITGEMLEQGVDSAKSWVDTITDPEMRTGALSRIGEELARTDLQGAVEWITQYAGEDAAGRAVSRIADQWAGKEPLAALEWADSLPDAAKALAYERALDKWTEDDPASAGEYLTNMAPSPARDSAVEGFATELAREEPANAMAWAETIADDTVRHKAVMEVARTWYRTDRTAATEWISASGLPEESVQTITQPGGDWRGGPGGRGRGGPGGGR